MLLKLTESHVGGTETNSNAITCHRRGLTTFVTQSKPGIGSHSHSLKQKKEVNYYFNF